jgi:fructosamine-3-kinase
VIGQVQARVAGCRAAREGCIGADDEDWIEGLLSAPAVRAALDEPFEPSWVHHDWKPNNVLAESGAGGWRITGVVDLMEGYFGDGEEDLVRSVAFFAIGDRGRIRRFTGRYREAQPLRPGFEERYRIYQLVDCLVVWEYGQRNRIWFPEALRLRAFAEPFVTAVQPF